jgi:hypothetical protein
LLLWLLWLWLLWFWLKRNKKSDDFCWQVWQVCLFLLLSSTTQICLIYLSFFLIVTNFTAGLIWFGFDWMEQVQQTILKHNTEKFWRNYWTMWNFKESNTHSHFEKENEIPNSISTLAHLHTFKLFGIEQKVNVNAMSSLHNQIQTFVIEKVRLTSNLNDKSNPIYTLTKLQHLELNGCKISELNETISNLTSLQILLLSNNYELNQLPSSMTKLTSLLHLSLNSTKIQSDTLISVVCQFPSLQVLELNRTYQLKTVPSQISQLTSTSLTFIKWNQITSNTNWITHSITHSQFVLVWFSQ